MSSTHDPPLFLTADEAADLLRTSRKGSFQPWPRLCGVERTARVDRQSAAMDDRNYETGVQVDGMPDSRTRPLPHWNRGVFDIDANQLVQ